MVVVVVGVMVVVSSSSGAGSSKTVKSIQLSCPDPRHEGLYGSQKYNYSSLSTAALDGGGRPHAPAAFLPKDSPGIHWIRGYIGARSQV